MADVMSDTEHVASIFPSLDELVARFDKKRGVLFLTVPNPGPALSIDVDGEVWLRIVPATKQIVGFEIEDFKRSLLKHHPDLAAEWYDPPIGSGSHEDREWHPERFVELAVCCLSQSLAARPVQLAPYT